MAKNGATKKAAPPKRPTLKFTPPESGAKGHRADYNLPVMVYLTKEQKTQLSVRARAEGLPLSTFIRKSALEAAKAE